MINSVPGNSQSVPEGLLDPAQAQEAQKTAAVQLDLSEDISFSRDTGENALAQALETTPEQRPTIPAPVPGAVASQGDLQGQYIQHHAAQIKAELVRGVANLESNNSGLLTNELLDQVESIGDQIADIESAPQHIMDSLHSSVRKLEEATEGIMTADELDEILMEIKTKLGDNSIRFKQEEIEIDAQDKIQQHDSNVEEIREGIRKAERAARRSKGLFALKIVAAVFIPPLGIFEAAAALDYVVNNRTSNISMFSYDDTGNNSTGSSWEPEDSSANYPERDSNQAGDEFWEERLDSDHSDYSDQQLEEARELLPASGEPDPVSEVTEGLLLAQNGLSQAEFMKMLQQIQESEEAKEKLAEAIAALEAGNPALAHEILTGSADASAADSGDAESASEESGLAEAGTAEADLAEAGTAEAPDDNQEAIREFNDFMDQMSSVPQATIDSQAISLREQGLIQRGSFA